MIHFHNFLKNVCRFVSLKKMISKMTRKRGTKNEVKIHKESLRILGQKRQTAQLKLMDLFFVLLLIC